MNEKTYGYIRVSAKDQNEARQLVAMREFGIPRERIVVEKCSGKDFQRPLYQKLLKKIRSGDVMVVKSIDRLGRNYTEILEQWRILTKEKGVDIVVLDMPLLDTRQGQDLTGRLIADIVLQLLSYVAETERENIRQRQAEGIAAARAQGVHLGRPQLPEAENFQQILAEWKTRHISTDEAARLCGVSRSTFYRWVKMPKNNCVKRQTF